MPSHAYSAAAAALAPKQSGRHSARILTHGTLEVRWYAPPGTDPQTPHGRDEVYVVVAGHGEFLCNGEASCFAPGDLLFAPAGAEHRLKDFSWDFAAWVIFYGPEGGEVNEDK